MKTSTKIIIGVATLATLGVGGFLTYRHFKKKKAALPQENQDDFVSPVASQDSSDYVPVVTTTQTAPASTSSTSTPPVTSGATNVPTRKGTSTVGYSFDKSAKTITVNAMGIGTQTFKLSDVKKVQQFMMDKSADAKAEMSAHGGADGKLGNYTAKWFATFVTYYSQSGIAQSSQLTVALSSLGVTTVK